MNELNKLNIKSDSLIFVIDCLKINQNKNSVNILRVHNESLKRDIQQVENLNLHLKYQHNLYIRK